MPEEEVKGAEGSEDGKKKSGLVKLIIIGVVALAVLGGGGFAAYKFFFAKPDAPKVEGAAEAAHGEKKEEKKEEPKKDAHGHEAKPAPPFGLEPFIVNLADPGGRRLVKLMVSLDVTDEKLKKELESRTPQIRESVILLLSSKTSSDIGTMAGKIKLKNEVLKIINNTLGGAGEVHALYLGDIVIQ